ncbi:MAG TPA: DUF4349 domain-containing protein [Acidimicrobiales bacterium]|jgi:hypothetical protein|nr:DUF4349 domain-containing protein [Acidimicrobiales bacterium]
MTMLDDDRLSALLGQAAEAFEVPAAGPDEIRARARGDGAGGDGADEAPATESGEDEEPVAFRAPGRGRRLVATANRHRILSVAAGLVVALLVAGTIGAVVRARPTPTVTAGLKAPNVAGSGGRALLPVTSTTSPLHAPAATGAPGPLGFEAQGTSGSAGGSTAAGAAPNSPSLPKDSVGQSTKIEQTGTLGLAVARGDLARTMTRLTSLAGAYGGFVASSASQGGSGGAAPYGTITLEVPVDNFSTVLKQAEQYGKTSNVSTKATDVTGQYVDLQARLAALEASRQQYLTILAKATSIGDILSVQEQLDNIQSQIEQLQGQLQVLTSETSYSTLNLTVSERGAPPRPSPLPESGLVQSWHDSVGGFVAGIDGVIRLAGPFLFALLCLAIVAVGGRLLWRRYQRHRL